MMHNGCYRHGLVMMTAVLIFIAVNSGPAAALDSGIPAGGYPAKTRPVPVQIPEDMIPLSLTILTVIPGIEGTGAGAVESGSDLREIGGAMILDGTTRMITAGPAAVGMGDEAVKNGIRQVTLADNTISPAVQAYLNRCGILRITDDAGIETLDLDEADNSHARSPVRWTAEQADAVFQWAIEMKRLKQVESLVSPAESYGQVLSVPAGGVIGGRVVFP